VRCLQSKRTVIGYGAMDKPSQDAAGQIQTAATSTYRGVRGWLLFFVLSLTVFTPLLQAYIIYSEKQSYNATPSPLLLSVLAIDWAMRGILIVFGLYAGIELWQMKPKAVQIAKAYLVAICIQQLVLLAVGIWIASRVASSPDFISSLILQPLRSFCYVVIWHLYLTKSKRVAATYGTQGR
jgi:hypothetical protein